MHPTTTYEPVAYVALLARPPDAQPDIIRQIAGHRRKVKGILAQKPLAMSYREAKECVELCAKAGIALGVNQNMRYDQSVRALKDILTRGWLGEPGGVLIFDGSGFPKQGMHSAGVAPQYCGALGL